MSPKRICSCDVIKREGMHFKLYLIKNPSVLIGEKVYVFYLNARGYSKDLPE